MNNPEPPDLHEEEETNDTQAAKISPGVEDQHPEASGETPQLEEQHQEVQEVPEVQATQQHADNEVSEVEIPNVGRITVRADADGYNEEVSPGVLVNVKMVLVLSKMVSSSLRWFFCTAMFPR